MTLLEQTEKGMINDTRERAFLFSPDGNRIIFSKEADAGKREIEFSDEELKLFEGNILTHSHPQNGFEFRTFSPDDIKLFFFRKLKGIRIVRGQSVFSLIHEDSCNCSHDDQIRFDWVNHELNRGASEDSMHQFLRSFPCLSLTEQSIEIM